MKTFFLLLAFKFRVFNLSYGCHKQKYVCALYITLIKLQFMLKPVSRWDVFNFNSWTYHTCEYWLKNTNSMLWYVYPKIVRVSGHKNLTMMSRSKTKWPDQVYHIVTVGSAVKAEYLIW